MKFSSPDRKITESDINSVEATIGLLFPSVLRRQYLQSNGGVPEPYVYEDACIDTVVCEFIPIISDRGRCTAVSMYQNLVLDKGIVFLSYFPFAIDGGGDYFFADCSTEIAEVSFFSGELRSLIPLSIGISEFWMKLKPE
ncbi:SMI1/KNR4 family protein [Pseudoduganella lutea]